MSDDALTAFARKRRIVAVLRALNDRLHSAEVLIQMEQLSNEEQAAFGKLLFSVSLAYQKLKTAALEPLRDALDRDAKDIDAATAELGERLESFEKVNPILDGTTAFLKVIGQIISIL